MKAENVWFLIVRVWLHRCLSFLNTSTVFHTADVLRMASEMTFWLFPNAKPRKVNQFLLPKISSWVSETAGEGNAFNRRFWSLGRLAIRERLPFLLSNFHDLITFFATCENTSLRYFLWFICDLRKDYLGFNIDGYPLRGFEIFHITWNKYQADMTGSKRRHFPIMLFVSSDSISGCFCWHRETVSWERKEEQASNRANAKTTI